MRHTDFVTELKHNEVFVFGSNLSGFHGAGSAGFAMRGETKNNWRQDESFCDIVYKRTSHRKGRWAVFGIGRGFQRGKEGLSYAIPTVERPGHQGCITEATILTDIIHLCRFARRNPELTFLVVQLGATRNEGGYSYFGIKAIRTLWGIVNATDGLPDNIILPESQEVRSQEEI